MSKFYVPPGTVYPETVPPVRAGKAIPLKIYPIHIRRANGYTEGTDTLLEAAQKALTGDLIIVFPGTYDIGSEIIKLVNDIHWQFSAGVEITGTHVNGVFTDNGVSLNTQWTGRPKINGLVSTINTTFIKKDSYDDYPYEDIVYIWDNATLKGFRYMVDAEMGDDSNDGLTWDTAWKTLARVQDAVPSDLQGAHMLILFHSGTYIGHDSLYPEIKSKNGYLRFVWVGTYVNVENSPSDPQGWCAWVRNGKDNPIRDNEPAKFETPPGDDRYRIIHLSSDGTLNFSFSGRNFNKGWSEIGAFYWDKMQFIGPIGKPTQSGYLGLIAFTGINIEGDGFGSVYLNEAKVGIECGNVSTKVNCLKVVGGSGEVSTSRSSWRGIYSLMSGSNISMGTDGIGWAVGFEPPNNNMDIKNFSGNLWSVPDLGSVDVLISMPNVTSKFYLDNSELADENVGLYLGSGGAPNSNIAYDNLKMDFTDASIINRTIKEYNNTTLIDSKTYLSGTLYHDADNFFFDGGVVLDLPVVDPVVAGALWNNGGVVNVSTGV